MSLKRRKTKMIKKLMLILLATLLLAGCGKRNDGNVIKEPEKPDPVEQEGEPTPVEQELEGMEHLTDSQREVFEEIDLKGLLDFFTKKKSGIVYIGYTDCKRCSDAVEVISNIASERDVTVYYLNIGKVMKDQEATAAYIKAMEPVLEKDKDDPSKRVISTPEIVRIEEGEFLDWEIGYRFWSVQEDYERVIVNINDPYRPMPGVQR